MPNERLDSADKPIPITRTVSGTQALIDNFVLMYRCRAHSAANGRQTFEVPAMLIGAGAATALAFGAPSGFAIAGGAATAALSAGKNYYSPQMKAAIFDSALDAILCIKSEAVGIDPISIGAISAAQEGGARALAAPGGNDNLTVSAAERYFIGVSAALLSVERVLAQRLSVVGTFDPAGVIAEIKGLAAEVEEKKTGGTSTATDQAKALVQDAGGGNQAVKSAVSATTEARIAQTFIQLETLQPKLQQCVVRAKI
ncbi:hypothetical protein U1737_08355 [Sphingomonas sp. LB3N6]|uniref:hypothetical protein n=1 Tax=Sphingomonas fucosidasi TaxID=3096164 RepID=UPI002FC9B761